MTEQDKQALIKHFCSRDCGEAAKDCIIMPCHEIELIQEFPTAEALQPANSSEIPNSSDTISRQAATQTALDFIVEYLGGAFNEDFQRKLIERMNTLPPVQPEIIRCGECKHRDPEDRKCDCGHDILWQLPRQDDWYCADAERRAE